MRQARAERHLRAVGLYARDLQAGGHCLTATFGSRVLFRLFTTYQPRKLVGRSGELRVTLDPLVLTGVLAKFAEGTVWRILRTQLSTLRMGWKGTTRRSGNG